MNIYEIPCNADGRKVRIFDSNVTGVRVYIESPCECPFCLDDDNDVQYAPGEDQGNEYFEERLSDCFE